MLFTSRLKVTCEPLKSSLSLSTCPVNFLKKPVTVAITRCFTLNCTSVCVGSIPQVVFVAVIVSISVLFLVFNLITQQRYGGVDRTNLNQIKKRVVLP